MNRLIAFLIVIALQVVLLAEAAEPDSGLLQSNATTPSSPSPQRAASASQPVGQPGTTPSPKPTSAPTPSPTPSGRLKYDAHIAAGKAFIEADDKVKAIESFEKALLAAPDQATRDAATLQLQSIATWSDDEWLGPPIGQLQALWPWIVLIATLVLLVISFLLLRRAWRALSKRFYPRYRIVIGPSDCDVASYFRDLIRHAHHAADLQISLASRIGAHSTATVAPAFRSTALLAELPLTLPAEVNSKWWAPLVGPITLWLDPPDFAVELNIMRTDDACGLSARLLERGRIVNHWHKSCAPKDLPDTVADFAFLVVSSISRHHSVRR